MKHWIQKNNGPLVLWVFVALLFGWMPRGAWCVDKPEFAQALPGTPYDFPRDFYSHDDYRIEWWYYTGNLEDADKRAFGYQLTFFRVGLEGKKKIENPSKWKIDHIYFAHLTVTDSENEKFYFFERINRRALGQAGARSDRLHVWNEDWALEGDEHHHRLSAREGGVGLELELVPEKQLVIHGKEGISVKGDGEGNASHYISYPRMKTHGRIFLHDREFEVTGTSWMDHEYSSNQMSPKQIGWDWFSIKLDNGSELMLYQLRLKDGKADPHSSGTWVNPDGSTRHIERGEFSIEAHETWESEKTGIVYPAQWTLTVKNPALSLQVTPEVADQELYNLRSISGSYWEGAVRVKGTQEGEPVRGKGYTELVGYGQPLQEELPE